MHQEIATESGKVVVVPDDGGLTGPLSDFTAELQHVGELRLFVPPGLLLSQVKRAELAVLATKDEVVEGMELIGSVISHARSVVIGDPHMLYRGAFGRRWVRLEERKRALQAVNRKHRVGSSYPTDTGETAVAVRLSSGASRYELVRWGKASFALLVTVFHEE